MADMGISLEALLPILIFIAVGAIITVFAVTESRKWQRRFEAIASGLGGEILGGRWLANRYVRTFQNGQEQRVRVSPKGKDRPPYLKLEQPAELDFDLSISKENIISRGMRKLGIDFEVKVGDPAFDDNYFLTSRSKEKAQLFLMSSSRREALDLVFSDGFNSVSVGRGMIAFHKPIFQDIDQVIDPANLSKWLGLLQKFAAG